MLSVDQSLLQKFSAHYVNVLGYPPNVSWVCAYMLFDFNSDGVTFEELVQFCEASKSTISGALKFLEEKEHIRHFYKEDDRKRYFVINDQYFINRYNDIRSNLINEKNLFIYLNKYKHSIGIQNPDLDEKFDSIIDIMNRNADSLNEAINLLTKFKKNH